jgi:hypothetical protein
MGKHKRSAKWSQCKGHFDTTPFTYITLLLGPGTLASCECVAAIVT